MDSLIELAKLVISDGSPLIIITGFISAFLFGVYKILTIHILPFGKDYLNSLKDDMKLLVEKVDNSNEKHKNDMKDIIELFTDSQDEIKKNVKDIKEDIDDIRNDIRKIAKEDNS